MPLYTAPLPPPTQPLWPSINTYYQDSLRAILTEQQFESLLAIPDPEARKTELLSTLSKNASICEAKVTKSNASAEETATKSAQEDLSKALHTLSFQQAMLGLHTAAHATLRSILDMYSKTDAPNDRTLSVRYNIPVSLLRQDRFREAEEGMNAVLPEMEALLGRSSGQALGGTRLLIEAVAGQGDSRREELGGLVEDARSRLDEMKGGRWEAFEAEEREALEELLGVIGFQA